MALTERICAICNKEIEEGTAPVVCVRCHALYHQKCWQGVDRCVVYGCNEPKESYGLVGNAPNEADCPECKKKTPRTSQMCLHCGKELNADIKRNVFVSNAKWRATDDKELIEGLSSHWDSGIRHLYGGDVEHWFAAHGHKDWAEKAAEIRKNIKQRSVGLETFLEFTGLTPRPELKITPPRLILESSSDVIETVLDIDNVGRGYLFGKIKPDVPWIELSEEELFGNRNRIEIKVDMEKIQNGTDTAKILLTSNGGDHEVEVKATRIGVENALYAYESGDIPKARSLCRRLIDTQMVSADVALVLAACYIHEGNNGGVVSALSKVTGGCVHIDDSIIQTVYDWLNSEGKKIAGLDYITILECMVTLAEGDLEKNIKSDIARLALERVDNMSDSAGAGNSLWQDHAQATSSVNELLAMAVELDPNVALEAHKKRKRFSGAVRKNKFQKFIWYVVLLAVLGGVSYGLWWVSNSSQDMEFRPIKAALDKKEYNDAIRQVRILCDNNPEETRYFKYYLDVIYARANDEIAAKKWDAVSGSINKLISITTDHFALSSTAAELTCKLAHSAEEAGCPTEARVFYEMASELDANNTDATVNKARLAATTDAFWKVYSAAQGDLGRGICDDCAHDPALQGSVASLESLGMLAYKGEMQLVFLDMTGDGQRELVVCGNDGKAKGSDGKGHCDVYTLTEGHLKRVYRDTSAYNHLLFVQDYDLSGTGRSDLAIGWGADVSGSTRRVELLTGKNGKFVSEEVKESGHVEFADYDGDGRIEVWVASSPDGSKYVKGVAVYSPLVWLEPGFIKATGNFNSYYQRCINEWEREIRECPKSVSMTSASYITERKQAIAALTKRLQEGDTAEK